jgi:hypothetical protein
MMAEIICSIMCLLVVAYFWSKEYNKKDDTIKDYMIKRSIK